MNEKDWNDLEGMMEKYHVADGVRKYIRKCVEFHTFPAAGLLLGVFMVDMALEKLGARPGEKLYAVSESPKCLPDPLQVIPHCTYGNHRLRVINTGRFSITVNRFSEGKNAQGVRVFVDAKKIGDYPTLGAWYMNDPSYKGGVSGNELLEEILEAGRDILSWEYVSIRVTPKEKWNSAKCKKCGEMVPENTMENGACRACGNMAYYDRAPCSDALILKN